MPKYNRLERHPTRKATWIGYCAALGGKAVRVTKDRSTGYWNATLSSTGPDHGTFVCRAATLQAMDRSLGA